MELKIHNNDTVKRTINLKFDRFENFKSKIKEGDSLSVQIDKNSNKIFLFRVRKNKTPIVIITTDLTNN